MGDDPYGDTQRMTTFLDTVYGDGRHKRSLADLAVLVPVVIAAAVFGAVFGARELAQSLVKFEISVPNLFVLAGAVVAGALVAGVYAYSDGTIAERCRNCLIIGSALTISLALAEAVLLALPVAAAGLGVRKAMSK